MSSANSALENSVIGDAALPETARGDIVELRQDGNTVIVRWRDDHCSRFHYIWLRDNCRCAACGDPVRGEKRLRVVDIPAAVKPRSIQLDHAGRLDVTWQSDGHKSRYESGWLRRHCYSVSERERRRRRPVLWDGVIMRQLPGMDYGAVLSDAAGRLRLLDHLRDYGICLVRDVPPRPGELESFSSSFGPMAETDAGAVFEIVVQHEEASHSVANLTRDLMPHTDDSYRETVPGVIFFHCLDVADDESGRSIFVDGFQIAEVLRREAPSAFDLLTRYAAPFRRRTGNIDMEACGPLIKVADDGRVTGVRINNLFAAPFALPEAVVEPYYMAYRQLMRLYMDRRYWITERLRSGDLMIFDNHRLLHGRTAISGHNLRRHLRYCSVARDYLYSVDNRVRRSDPSVFRSGG